MMAKMIAMEDVADQEVSTPKKMGLTQKESGNVPNAGKEASRPEEMKLTDLK